MKKNYTNKNYKHLHRLLNEFTTKNTYLENRLKIMSCNTKL